jgi:hypothetical protein
MFHLAHHLAAKAENALRARHLNQRHFPLLAGLEAHGGAAGMFSR